MSNCLSNNKKTCYKCAWTGPQSSWNLRDMRPTIALYPHVTLTKASPRIIWWCWYLIPSAPANRPRPLYGAVVFFYIIHFFQLLRCRVGPLNLRTASVPPTIVHCGQNEAAHKAIKSLHGLRYCRMKTPTFVPKNWWNWKTTWPKSVPVIILSIQEPSKWNFFPYMQVILHYFIPESRLMIAI